MMCPEARKHVNAAACDLCYIGDNIISTYLECSKKYYSLVRCIEGAHIVKEELSIIGFL